MYTRYVKRINLARAIVVVTYHKTVLFSGISGVSADRARITPSARPYRGLAEVDYPLHDWTATVTHSGRICWKRRKINLSLVFAGQNVGVGQVSDRVWLVSYMDYDLGYFDDETCRLEPVENPFSPRVLPMSPE